MISEATDLLRLHKLKPLKHRQALAAAHALYDPVQSAPFLAAQMKLMYRFLILQETLENKKGGGSADYDAILSDDFVHNHLVHAVEGAQQTKRRLNKSRKWRLPPCIDIETIRISLDCLCNGAWGTHSGSACICYLVQRYVFNGENRVKQTEFSNLYIQICWCFKINSIGFISKFKSKFKYLILN